MKILNLLGLFLLLPVLALAQEILPAAPSAEEVIGLVQAFVEASKAGHWGLAAALAIMAAVWALRTFFWKSLPAKAVPWVTAAVGVLLAFATSVQAGSSLFSAAIAGVFTGAAASGLWSLVGKHALPSPKKADSVPSAEPPVA